MMKNNKNRYYMLSMSLIFMFFYSLLIVSNSQRIYELAQNMETMKKIFPAALILAFLVAVKFASDGISQVLIRERKKLGIYCLAGNKNTRLAYMISLDLMKSLPLAVLAGMVLGALYSRFIVAFLEMIFGISHISVPVVTIKILAEYAFLLLVVLAANYWIAYFTLVKKDIKDFIYNENILKVEDAVIKKGNPKIYASITLLFFLLTLLFIILTKENAGDDISLYYSIGGLVCGSFFIYRLSKLMLMARVKRDAEFLAKRLFAYVFANEVKRNWKKYYRNQCLSVTILALACLALFISLTVGYSYKENIAKEAPFDLAVSVDAKGVDFTDVRKVLNTKDISEEIQYKIYNNEELGRYNLPTQCMKLSDYNRLRKLLKKEAFSLEKNQFLLQVEDISVEKKIKKEATRSQILLKDKSYRMKREIENFPFLQANMNGRFSLLVFNDEELDQMQLPVLRNIMVAEFKKQPPAQLKNEIQKALKSSANLVSEGGKDHITIKVILKEWSRLNGLVALSVLTVFGIFASSLFMLIGVSSIAFFSIKDLDKLDRENKIYWNLGWGIKDVRRYNAYRVKALYKNSLYLIVMALLPSALLLYFGLIGYLDRPFYVFIFAFLSFGWYIFLMFSYRIGLIRILCSARAHT